MDSHGTLKRKQAPKTVQNDSLPKKLKLLEDDSSESDQDIILDVNEQYAKRFKHNKERAEIHRLEEKYGKDFKINDHLNDSSTSDDETEDEDGELANEAIDAEISATIEAIRSKDPRIYQKDASFYTTVDNTDETAQKNDMDKPLYLRDYHRKNLLENGGGPVEETDDNIEPLPYVLEQEALKSSIVREINAEGEREMEDASEDDDFLVKKERSATDRTTSKPAIPNISTADEDPENFLSNFFASRAWVPTDTAKFHPLESDDEEEQARADKFENAWNLRFEDPDTSNKTLTSHSRDIVAKYSVRREEITGRKKAREREKERKLEEKKEREEEKKLLRSLKISEMEQKLEKIRDAAGLSGKSVSIEEWTDMLEGDWDDDEWNEQMQARFGEDYYEKDDNLTDANNVEPSKAKPEKPKWGDDIDINDLVPEFNDEDDPITAFRDSDDEQSQQPENATRNRAEARNQARRDRRIIEALADQSLPLDVEMGQSSKPSAPFRYRETSPNSFGLTPLDIFAAEDAQLNQFVGLKKLATFRDPERKRKDKKKLGKKARLRNWRKETFGLEEGPPLQSVFSIPTTQDQTLSNMEQVEITDVENGTSLKHQKKRKRKSKAKS